MAEYDYEVQQYMEGMRAYTTEKGIRVIELDYICDPDHTPEWVAEQRKFSTARQWRREMERDWTTPAGEPYFAGFGEIGKEAFIRQMTNLLSGPVFVGFDFGRRYPAMGCFQYSVKSDRLWLVREFLPHDLFSHEFRDACRFLLGMLPWEKVPERGQQRINEACAKPSGLHCPPWPRPDGTWGWFPPGTQYVFVGGKEAMQSQSNVTKAEDAVVADIFATGGMPLILVNPDVFGRNQLFGRFVSMREDGYPGVLIDPQCELTLLGFEGRWSFPKPTPSNPHPTDPHDDGWLINLLDAWGYGVSAVCPLDPPKPARPRQVVAIDGRTPIYTPPEDEVGWAGTSKHGRRRRR